MIAVVAIAYGSQAPALGVAEFAPAARQALESPPTTAGSDSPGSAARAGRAATTTTVSAPTASVELPAAGAPTTIAARARRCYGDPPLQTEDPMSPACLATIFEGENGGATSRGVSTTEIRVAVPVTPGFSTSTSTVARAERETLMALFEYINQRFELYGRRLLPTLVEGQASDAVTSRTLGTQMAANQPFAGVIGPIELTALYPQVGLIRELARNQVVTVTRSQATWWSDRAVFDEFHPYVWSIAPSSEQLQADLGAVGCALGGSPAAFTLDPDVAGRPRRFGVVSAGHQLPPSADVLLDALEACGGGASAARFDWTNLGDPSWAALRTAITKFASDGVTTVFCVCESHFHDWVAYVGHSLGFEPEMVFTPSGYSEGDERIAHFIRGDGVLPMQVQTGPRLVPLQVRPWYQAVQTVNPALLGGDPSVQRGVFSMAEFVYPELLVLASGIQAAGPRLTPETFAAGLMATQFPNPAAGQAPRWLPTVGFGPGDHSFYSDFAIGWFSDTAPALEPYAPTPMGSWCYVGSGMRFRPDTVPGDLDAHLFNAYLPCR